MNMNESSIFVNIAQQTLRNKYASVLCIKHLLPSKEHGKGASKGQRNNILRLSPFEVEYWKTSK